MTAPAARGFIITAPHSGAGKTTVTLGLLRALKRRGIAVQPFKCGPDYIDAAFHGVAAGRDSINLDMWAMRPELIASLVAAAGAEARLCVAEGVMGLFDGASQPGQCGNGATADLAAFTGWPVVLVLDVYAQAETAAAVALGCKLYREDVNFAGVILNRVASEGHAQLIMKAMAQAGLPVLGVVRHGADIVLPERHLGLVQAQETGGLQMRLDAMADAIEAGVDIDAVMAAARPARSVGAAAGIALPPPGQRVALAQDRAFSFIYPHLLSGWRNAGAEIVTFSPLNDEAPDAACDAVWLPGGYPELNAPALANAQTFKSALRACADRGVPIHGECGGYMVLGSAIETADGFRHEMTGLLGLVTSFAERRLHLGYRRARCHESGNGALAGGEMLGHEFHFASVLASPDEPFATIADAGGVQLNDGGSRRGSVSGSFFHLIDYVA